MSSLPSRPWPRLWDLRLMCRELARNDQPVIKRFTPIFTLVALCWLVFVVNNLLWIGRLNQYGIVPRHLGSLPAILWAPLLHSSLKHLIANTGPLLILGAILCLRRKTEFAIVAIAGTLLGGGLTWIVARNACHIGASGLVFCFFGYLASMAYFRRAFGSLALSALCLLGYGGMLKGILPSSASISWESHMAGLVAGIALAWLTSKFNPPHKKLVITPTSLTSTLQE